MSQSSAAEPEVRILHFAVEADEEGMRLDRFLAQRCHVSEVAHIGALSRARLQALIKSGAVRLAGTAVNNANQKVKAGDAFVIEVGPPVAPEPVGQAMDLDIVYEDRDLIVLNKPAGLVVHPAAGHADGTLVNALIAHCGDSLSGIGGVKRPGIVHRLDKDTTGLLVVAKNDAAHQGLSEQFQLHGADGRLQREYLAVVWGHPPRPRGTIDAPLGRSRFNRTKIAVVRNEEDGRRAVTHYSVEERFAGPPGTTLLRLALETGRTHQIRVHLAHAGYPILGDGVYGTSHLSSVHRLSKGAQLALARLRRQALHATILGFEHPRTGKRHRFERPPPADMQALIAALRSR